MHAGRLALCSIPEESSPPCIFASRGATVVCVVSGYGGGVGGRGGEGPHRLWINLQSAAEVQTGDVIR